VPLLVERSVLAYNCEERTRSREAIEVRGTASGRTREGAFAF